MLMGPYQISDVDSYVTPRNQGVYILSRDGRTSDYVGRSDTDVGARIKGSASEGYGYTYFWFEYATSKKDAFNKECGYYHDYNPPDNESHPAVPFGTNWKCPIMGCPWS